MQSRYYDSVTGRFLNADDQINDNSIIGTNLFAYCNNNFVNMMDSDGKIGRVIVIMGIYFLATAIITLCLTSAVTSPGFIRGWNQMCAAIPAGIARGFKGLGIAFNWANSQEQSIARGIELSFVRSKGKHKYRSVGEWHHIVAKAAKNANYARRVLKNVNIGYNDGINLIYIKTGLHRRIHTKQYYAYANSVVISAYNNGKNFSQRKLKVKKALINLRAFIEMMDKTAPF